MMHLMTPEDTARMLPTPMGADPDQFPDTDQGRIDHAARIHAHLNARLRPLLNSRQRELMDAAHFKILMVSRRVHRRFWMVWHTIPWRGDSAEWNGFLTFMKNWHSVPQNSNADSIHIATLTGEQSQAQLLGAAAYAHQFEQLQTPHHPPQQTTPRTPANAQPIAAPTIATPPPAAATKAGPALHVTTSWATTPQSSWQIQHDDRFHDTPCTIPAFLPLQTSRRMDGYTEVIHGTMVGWLPDDILCSEPQRKIWIAAPAGCRGSQDDGNETEPVMPTGTRLHQLAQDGAWILAYDGLHTTPLWYAAHDITTVAPIPVITPPQPTDKPAHGRTPPPPRPSDSSSHKTRQQHQTKMTTFAPPRAPAAPTTPRRPPLPQTTESPAPPPVGANMPLTHETSARYTAVMLAKEKWNFNAPVGKTIGEINTILAGRLRALRKGMDSDTLPANEEHEAAMQSAMVRIFPDNMAVQSPEWERLTKTMAELNLELAKGKPSTTIPAARSLLARLKALQATG